MSFVGRVSRRRNPPPWRDGNGGLRFANPPYGLRDEHDFARHMDYIYFNPVKHGHVSCVADWPFSSFHRMVRLGVYPPDWAGKAGEIEAAGGFGER